MAFGLTVYASPRGLPRYDARLVSGRWSDAAGRASTRRVPTEGFRVFPYISSPFPKLCLAQSHRPKHVYSLNFDQNSVRILWKEIALSPRSLACTEPLESQPAGQMAVPHWPPKSRTSPKGQCQTSPPDLRVMPIFNLSKVQ